MIHFAAVAMRRILPRKLVLVPTSEFHAVTRETREFHTSRTRAQIAAGREYDPTAPVRIEPEGSASRLAPHSRGAGRRR
jgi:hypothetical protein